MFQNLLTTLILNSLSFKVESKMTMYLDHRHNDKIDMWLNKHNDKKKVETMWQPRLHIVSYDKHVLEGESLQRRKGRKTSSSHSSALDRSAGLQCLQYGLQTPQNSCKTINWSKREKLCVCILFISVSHISYSNRVVHSFNYKEFTNGVLYGCYL